MTSPIAESENADRRSSHANLDAEHQSEAPGSPSKRKNSEVAAGEVESGKKKRRKVNHACVYCRRSHMTCDLQRPCARCVKRDIGHLCHDEPRDPPKKSKSEAGVADIAPAPEESKTDDVNGSAHFGAHNNGDFSTVDTTPPRGPRLAQPSPISPDSQRPGSMANASASMLPNFDWNNNGMHNQFQDMHHLHPNYMFNTSEVTNEYNLLNDFLSNSLLDEGAIYNPDDAQVLFNDPLLPSNNVNLANSIQQQQGQRSQILPPPNLGPPPQTQFGNEISRPSSAFPNSDKARERFYMTAADPAGLSSAEDRLHKLLKAKYDAGMLKPFNHVKGYARLNTYMSRHLTRESQLRIAKQLERFRPKFREAMHSLTDMQLVLVEMWFERSLMEYDRVFASMAIPACCWRRTGEIFRGNREMAELIGVGMERLRDGRLALHEILEEDSLVSYWEKFSAIAFEQSQKAILTSCSLKSAADVAAAGTPAEHTPERPTREKRRSKEGTLRCCFSFTIRRDTHNMYVLSLQIPTTRWDGNYC